MLWICTISGLLIIQYIVHKNEWKKGSNPFIRVEGRSMNRMPLYTFSAFFFKNGILLNIEMLYLEVSPDKVAHNASLRLLVHSESLLSQIHRHFSSLILIDNELIVFDEFLIMAFF